MVPFFFIDDIALGPASRATGHEAHLQAVYNPPDKTKPSYRIIYKKNKYGYAQFSRWEVRFSHLARLFLMPDLTPSHHLVVNEGRNVLGLSVRHLGYTVEHKEGLQRPFYSLNNPQKGCESTALKVDDPTKIPIYFFDKLPQGFYSQMVEAETRGDLTIDYESLASILTTSYTMEEDDLHKGNFGFYLVEKEGRPHAVFFKIDHDLMFVDSIMGFHTRRYFHLMHAAQAFAITAEDLRSFPRLKSSCNSYWPTQFNYFSNPFDNKEYHNYADIDAFAQLSRNPNFIKAKWKSLYKHILIPNELIDHALKESADRNSAADRADVALITQATLSRLARLRAVLFSMNEFRAFVRQFSVDQEQALLKEILPPSLRTEKLVRHILDSFAQYKALCTSANGFEQGDTPLHTAIKLGEYRYEETLSMFSHFINVRNKAGKTPLDVALDRVRFRVDARGDAQKDAYLIMNHLLEHGATKTRRYHQSGIHPSLKAYHFKNPYLKGMWVNMPYEEFKGILRDIGEDSRFCLKFKKNLAIECIKYFIKLTKNHPLSDTMLVLLREDINGYSSEEECAGVKYIRQLRSRLWIVRQLRGLYGLSSTQWEINGIIKHARERIKANSNSRSFFSCQDAPNNPKDTLAVSEGACCNP